MATSLTHGESTIPDDKEGHVRSYNDLLPASYRTPDDDVESPKATTSFLRKELGVDRLNHVHHWLWLVGRPIPPRPLYYQKAIGRNIIVHQQTDLHLVWDEQRIFLKPVPRYLLDQNFCQDLLKCKDRCALNVGKYNQDEKRREQPSFGDFQGFELLEREYCKRCSLRRLANGFLITYTSLISYEQDLRMAKTLDLVPSEISWSQWRELVRTWLTPEKKTDINPRYYYGELRLGRLNDIYRLTLRSPIRGYLHGHRTYYHFWNTNLARITAALGYIIVVLTAMQVGLATDRLGKSNAFQDASYGFTVFSILAPLILLGCVGIVFIGVFTANLFATLRFNRDKFAGIEKQRNATAMP